MATTEDAKANVESNPAPPAAPAPALAMATAPTPALPSYPEMILAAIDSLNDKNGSNKSSIWKQMESTYGNLPAAHSTLLTHHLDGMKATGQLVLLKNNYLRPDPNAPPRRGRGRPPKAKPALPPGYVPPPPRPRGRPPKSRDPLAHPPPPPPPKRKAAVSPATGRKRGRPPKVPRTGPTPTPAAAGPPSGAPRGRGRPSKVKPAVSAAATTVGA